MTAARKGGPPFKRNLGPLYSKLGGGLWGRILRPSRKGCSGPSPGKCNHSEFYQHRLRLAIKLRSSNRVSVDAELRLCIGPIDRNYCGKHGLALPRAANNVNIDRGRR